MALYCAMLCLCCAHVRPILGPVLRHILGPCWAYVGLCCAYIGPMLGIFWAHVGHMLGHVEPKFGNLPDFRPLKQTWEKGFESNKGLPPKLKVNSYNSNCFRLMRAHKKASAPSVRADLPYRSREVLPHFAVLFFLFSGVFSALPVLGEPLSNHKVFQQIELRN